MKMFMNTTESPVPDDRSPTGKRAKPELSHERTHHDLQRGIVSALAKSVRKFRKRPRFSPVWREAMRNLTNLVA
jgi:hypothetical protein